MRPKKVDREQKRLKKDWMVVSGPRFFTFLPFVERFGGRKARSGREVAAALGFARTIRRCRVRSVLEVKGQPKLS